MKKFIFILMMLLASLTSFAQLSVLETISYTTIDKPKTELFTISNKSSTPIRVQIRVGNHPDNNIPKEKYIGDYVKVFPLVMNIPGDSTRTIRYTIQAPNDLPSGEYKAYLYFKEIPSEELKVQAKGTVAIGFLTEIGIPVVARKGNLTFDATAKDLKLEESEANYKVTGLVTLTGERSERVKLSIGYYQDNKLVAQSPSQVIPTGTTFLVEIPMDKNIKHNSKKIILESASSDFKKILDI